MKHRIAQIVLLVSAFALRADAQGFHGTPTGLTAPGNTLTFETNAGFFTAVGSQYSAQGVTFGPGAFIDQNLFSGVGGGAVSVGNNADLNASCGQSAPCHNPIDIFFTDPTWGVAMQFASAPGPVTFTAFLAGNQVGVMNFNGDISGINQVEFFGFDETLQLDELEISLTGTPTPEWAIDNLQYDGTEITTSPEPASLVLVATGLSGLGAIVRRKRSA